MTRPPVFWWPAIAPVRPTRQSERPPADASGNRRFVLPSRVCSLLPEAGLSHPTARPLRGGRSAARRVVSGGMLAHPRKRTKHGWRGNKATAARTSTATGREGNELRSSESEPLCVVRVSHRASASVASAATSTMRKHGARSGPGQPPAQERSDKPGASSCRINRKKSRASL
jgi:hypothetical protein